MLLRMIGDRIEALIADKGYDSDWFREALADLKITPCIPGRANRKAPIPYDADLYKQRNRIERMFGRLKDWRRIATRYDRCAPGLRTHMTVTGADFSESMRRP